MPISQLPPGTPSEVRGPDNEDEDNIEFNSNNTNQFVRLFDYHSKNPKNELKTKSHSLRVHFVHLQFENVIVK